MESQNTPPAPTQKSHPLTFSQTNSNNTKYIILALFNFICGGIYFFTILVMLFKIIPNLSTTYSHLNYTGVNPLAYIFSVIILLGSIVTIYFGIKVLTNKNDRSFQLGLISLLAEIFIGGFLYGVTIITVINPIYSLVNSIDTTSKASTSTIPLTPTPTVDPTTNWQTITLKQLSFKIPQGWWNEKDQTVEKNNSVGESISVNSVATGAGKPALIVSFDPDTDLNQIKIAIMRGLNNSSTSSGTVAGITGVTLEGIGVLNPIAENGNGDVKIILLQRPEGVYSIENYDFSHRCKPYGGSDSPQTMSDYCTPIYNQILSTFSFTDKNQTTGATTPTCMPRPSCLNATPRCLMPEPAQGWCSQ